MKGKGWGQVRLIIGVLVLCMGMFVGDVAGESLSLEDQVMETLNLGANLIIERYGFENNQVLLWREPSEQKPGYVKNWGIVLLKNEQPQHLWFYTGPISNNFSHFHLSFHQFTQDGRKELALVGTDQARKDWAYYFILNLEDQGIQKLAEGENNSRGGSYFVQPHEIFNQGMFMDLDLDHVEELFLYREVKGTLLPGPIWPEIYNWDGERFVLTSDAYPTFYIPFFKAFEAAAVQEEQVDGNYQIFYEYIARIYEIWGESVGVREAKERALLPPLQMGLKMREMMKQDGFTTYRTVRVDLDGQPPKDALVWGKLISDKSAVEERTQHTQGGRDQIWLVAQHGQELVGPFSVLLPERIFQEAQGLEIHTWKNLIQFSTQGQSQPQSAEWSSVQILPQGLSQPQVQVDSHGDLSGRSTVGKSVVSSKPGEVSYTFAFDDQGVDLVGRQECLIFEDGRRGLKLAGRVLTSSDTKIEIPLVMEIPLLQASPSEERVKVDGIFSDQAWSKLKPLTVGDKKFIRGGVENWQGEDDLSVAWQGAYDQEALYLGIRVKDDQRSYAQKSTSDQNRVHDHVEFWFTDQGQIYHYGIFLEATGVRVVQWLDGQGAEQDLEVAPKLSHQIDAQWMPMSGGYWVEVRVPKMELKEEVYPFTLGVVDVDQPGSTEIETLLATSPYQPGEEETLGWILLR